MSAVTDPIGAQPTPPLHGQWSRLVNDPRDTVFVWLAVQCSLVALAGLSLYVVFSWWLALAYIVVWAATVLDRYILMLHCTSHRPLFNKRFRWLRHWIPVVLGPFFGQTPHTYFTHHMGMHHREGNLLGDLSTTMPFRRDSLRAWLKYFGTFFFFGIFQLANYHRSRKKMFWRTVLGEASWYLLVIGMMFVSWKATLVVFVFPFVLVRVLMMAGNWGQHAFVDPDEPGNDFKSSITCINTRYNRRCFNDGYHIVHHRKPALHYTEMAAEFDRHREHYGQQDAIVFEGIDFFQVWLYLMLGRHDWLARRFVQLPGAPERSEADIVAFLKYRLEPFPTTATK